MHQYLFALHIYAIFIYLEKTSTHHNENDKDIKTNNIILKTEIGDKCRETITNEKTDGVHLSYWKF